MKGEKDDAAAADVWGGLQGEGGPGCSQSDRTTAQLASEYGIHAGQVMAWKKQLMTQVTDLFADGRKRRPDETANEHELYEQIGRLKMEIEWSKKPCRARLRGSGNVRNPTTNP